MPTTSARVRVAAGPAASSLRWRRSARSAVASWASRTASVRTSWRNSAGGVRTSRSRASLMLHDGMRGNDDASPPGHSSSSRVDRDRRRPVDSVGPPAQDADIVHQRRSSERCLPDFPPVRVDRCAVRVSPCRETPIYSTLGIAGRRGHGSHVGGRWMHGPSDDRLGRNLALPQGRPDRILGFPGKRSPPRPRGVSIRGAESGVTIQFAVLASGSRGNSTLVRGAGPGLLIDAGIGPRALAERLESVGASWSDVGRGGPDPHPRRSHRLGDLRRAGPPRRGASTATRGIARHWPATRASGGWRRPGLVSCYEDDRPFLTATGLRLEPITLRHDGGPTFGFRIEASAGAPGPAGEHRLPGRYRELVRADGRRPGRRRRARRRVQPRRGDAEVVRAALGPDQAQPRRPRAPLQPTGGRAGRGGAAAVAARGHAAPGPAAPEPAVQRAGAGDRGRAVGRARRGASRGRACRAAGSGPSQPLDPPGPPGGAGGRRPGRRRRRPRSVRRGPAARRCSPACSTTSIGTATQRERVDRGPLLRQRRASARRPSRARPIASGAGSAV